MLCQFALQVGSLVLGDGLFGGKAVEQRAYFAVASFGSSLVGHLAEVADSVAGRLGIVAVAQAAASFRQKLLDQNRYKAASGVCNGD